MSINSVSIHLFFSISSFNFSVIFLKLLSNRVS
ncbi:hypothetical protein LINPERHAP2_LOCUS20685 [Linum perenne]